ncbi:MAG: DUF2442 domain-containing protein [Bacteroidetes bacterium]|nr:DUF2442 domain-containing protein [Bacteroidota bacterium]
MQIIKAEYISGYKVKLFFDDNKQQVVDFGEFILSSPYAAFNQYKDLKKFKRFKLENGNIVWGKNWDLIFPLEQLRAGKIKIPKKNYETAYSDYPLVAAEPRAQYGKKK